MDTNLILAIISIATTSIVGIILYRQIKSQKEIIQNYRTYIETLDIDRFKKYIETAESLSQKKILIEKENYEIETERFKSKTAEKYAKQSTEMAMLIAYFFNTNSKATKDEKLELLKKALPLTHETVSLIIK